MAEEGGWDPCAEIIWPGDAVWRRDAAMHPTRGVAVLPTRGVPDTGAEARSPARRREERRLPPAGCQFIAGEPCHTDRGKCGRPVSGTTAYCARHRALCLLPPPEDEFF